MSDDTREREPLRNQGDNAPDRGLRSDTGGSSDGPAPIAAGGKAVDRIGDRVEGAQGDGDDAAAPADPMRDAPHPTLDE